MRKSSRFAALALTAALALGVATPAFAESATAPSVEKELKTNNGSAVEATFNFTATKKQLTGNGAATTAETPEATIAAITINEALAETTKTGTGAITFGSGDKTGIDAFPHAGVYAYTITETNGAAHIRTDGRDGMSYNTGENTTYTLLVNVKNVVDENNDPTGALEFAEFVIAKGDVSTYAGEDSTKATKLAFENKYWEYADDDNDTIDLTVTKQVKGASADKTKPFKFTVTFTAPSIVPAGWDPMQITISGDILDESGNTTTASVVKSGDSYTATFYLKDDGKASFANVVAGTTYTVDEDDYTSDGYTTDGEVTTAKTANESGQDETVTNTKTDITVTGLILDNAPFLILGATAVAGIVLYGAAKRKLTA